MTSTAIPADQLYQRLPFREQLSREKLAKSLKALKPGDYIFVATHSRPNARIQRTGLLSFLGFKPGERWRSRRWAILTSDRYKLLPDHFHVFLDRVDFRVGGK